MYSKHIAAVTVGSVSGRASDWTVIATGIWPDVTTRQAKHSEYVCVTQGTSGKKNTKLGPEQTEKVESFRQQATLDRLRFKVNETMQLLKEEQKQQEGKGCTNCYLFHPVCDGRLITLINIFFLIYVLVNVKIK